MCPKEQLTFGMRSKGNQRAVTLDRQCQGGRNEGFPAGSVFDASASATEMSLLHLEKEMKVEADRQDPDHMGVLP